MSCNVKTTKRGWKDSEVWEGGAVASGMVDYLVLWKPTVGASLGRGLHWKKLSDALGSMDSSGSGQKSRNLGPSGTSIFLGF